MEIYWRLPFGKAVATSRLTDCNSTNGVGWMEGLTMKQIELEQVFGNFTKDRFALTLKDIQRIAKPFPVTGRQGLFNVEVPEELLR